MPDKVPSVSGKKLLDYFPKQGFVILLSLTKLLIELKI